MTGVTSRLVAEIGSVPVGRGAIVPASGDPIETTCFGLHLSIPVDQLSGDGKFRTFAVGRSVVAFELPYQPSDYDVLLGMDVLGDFHITMQGGLFIMSN